MKHIINVIRFEYKGFVNTKTFRTVTLVFVICILVAVSIPRIAGAFQSIGVGENLGNNNKAALILTGEVLTNEVYKDSFTGDALEGTGAAMWIDLSNDPPSDETLSEAIRNGEYLFAIRYSGGPEYDFYAAGNRISSYEALGPMNEYITSLARNAEIAALPADEQAIVTHISALTAEPNIINIGGDAASNVAIGYILIMFLLYTIIGYANYVSSSIVTEKTSKAMELLITSVKPLYLMVGKVIGVGLAALTQVGVIVAAFALGIAINMPYWKATNGALLDLMQGGNVSAAIALIVIVYFLLGFFLYAFLIAAFASTVTRPEEAATVTLLPTLLLLTSLMFGFLTLFGVLGKTAVAALSFVPFFTPIILIARYTVGDTSTGQLVLGAVIMAVAIVVVAYLAAKIFRMGVMLYGVKATPKQIFRALKNS